MKGERKKEEKRKGEKKRGAKKRKGEGKKVPQQGSNPRPSTLQPTAYNYQPEVELHTQTKPTYIVNLDCHELRAGLSSHTIWA